MKRPISLQAISSKQAYRDHLKTYERIELLERGKPENEKGLLPMKRL